MIILEKKGDKEMKYWIVDCISGYRDEEDEVYTDLKEAKAECKRMNADAVKEGHSPNFWIIVDESGKEVDA